MNKPIIIFSYDGLQRHHGAFIIIEAGNVLEKGHFLKTEVSGNFLLVNGSDNGLTKEGRLMHIFDLNKFDVKFE